MRRARAVLLVTALATVFVVVTAALALAQGPTATRRDEYGVRLSRLAAGVPVAVPVTLPGPDAQRSRVVFVRHDGTVSAYLAADPRYGCALLVPGDADLDRLFVRSDPERVLFYDNCGGAVYGPAGRCNGGPCLRNLDVFPVRVEAGRARIDVRERRAGDLRTGRVHLPDWCLRANPAAVVAGAAPACR